MKYKTIDLCAGIGGIRKGFELTERFENVLSAEIDEYAARTYEHMFGDDPRNDLTSPEFKNLVADTEYDVLLAGFPCQPFSSAGNLEGFDDQTKGTIFFHIKQIIRRTRPKAVFLENVQNLVSHRNGSTMRTIIKILEKELNYKVIGVSYDAEGRFVYDRTSFVRNTINFGLPQNRPRAYILAFDRELFGSAADVLPNKLPESRRRKDIFSNVSEILEPVVDIRYYMSATYLETLEKHKENQKQKGNGFGYCVVNDQERKVQKANTILATGGSGKERNLVYQQMPEYNPEELKVRKKGGLNTKNIRIMTPKEWGRLQGFIDYAFVDPNTGEDTFSFPENMPESQKYKQFGNSVSIPVIEEMALFMLECLDSLDEQAEEKIRRFVLKNGKVKRQDVMLLLKVNGSKASYLLRKWEEKGILIQRGERKGAYYVLK